MKISEVQSKSVLTKSALPSDDFVINPYSGCTFGCAYCYADFMRRFSGHLQDKWGEYVDVRVNAPEVLDREIRNLMKRLPPHPPARQAGRQPLTTRSGECGSVSSEPGEALVWKGGAYPNVLISSVCDPYQGLESKYKLTRQILEVFIKHDFPGEISILTKSPLVTRDIDLLKKLKKASVGLTITSTDDKVSRLIEKNAPPSRVRLRALKILNESGIKTYVCVNPLLPHYADSVEKITDLFRAIKKAGTNEIFVEHLNLSGQKKSRLFNELKNKVDTNILEKFWFSQNDEYKRKLEETVYETLNKYELKILGGGIIDHERLMNKKGTKFVMR